VRTSNPPSSCLKILVDDTFWSIFFCLSFICTSSYSLYFSELSSLDFSINWFCTFAENLLWFIKVLFLLMLSVFSKHFLLQLHGDFISLAVTTLPQVVPSVFSFPFTGVSYPPSRDTI
jgi:hypothetical protein